MKSIITFLLGALIMFAWGPWTNGDFVYIKLAEDSQKEFSPNATSSSCIFKEILSQARVPFGYSVTAEYSCTSSEPMKRRMFVASSGNVFVLSKLVPVNPDQE